MARLDKVYSVAPVWVQHWAASGYGIFWKWLRFGPGYQDNLDGFQRRERFTVEDWRAWQDKKLKSVLRASVENVPYYSAHWTPAQKLAAKEGLLQELPLLAKDAIRASPQSFLSLKMHPFYRQISYTSGSTGTPVTNYFTPIEFRRTQAVREARSAQWAGVSFSQPRATFSGRLVVPDPNSRGPFHRFNCAERQVYLSAFHLNAANAEQYVAALRSHGITWMTGYAVSFYLLGRHILEQKIKIPPLKAVITTSEKVTQSMRTVMEQAYQCRVFEEYSTVENVFFASECEHRRLHVSPDAGVIEILRPDGSACAPGEEGEVVATGLMRDYQPFIRYRIGDIAAWSPDLCPCGRNLPVLQEVAGRIEDVVVGPDGREMVRFHGIFINQPHVLEAQVVQESLDLIRIRVVTSAGYGLEDENDIISRVRQRLGEVRVIVEPVRAIQRTKAGKFKAVVSHLKKIE